MIVLRSFAEASSLDSSLSGAVREELSNRGVANLRIEHCLIQVALRPVQLEIFFDEGRAIDVDGVHVGDGFVLWYSADDQAMDFERARSVEECSKDVFAITKKILRSATDDHARAGGKRVIDCGFRNGGDAARIEQFEPVGWRQAAFECAA